jgi:hypothetical protein
MVQINVTCLCHANNYVHMFVINIRLLHGFSSNEGQSWNGVKVAAKNNVQWRCVVCGGCLMLQIGVTGNIYWLID